ncbi:MAG TPA: protein-disulfide reductase DsbD, partial [Steroidobacteraceae bacterium]|nr:protein-disulfide reductase DsbD [Steroidobacteraceae bacterium]
MRRSSVLFLRQLALCAAMLLPAAGAWAQDFLKPQEAFKYSVEAADGKLAVRYRIAPGYYLYRERMGFESATAGVSVGPAELPAGEDHEDEFFGRQQVYRGELLVPLGLTFDGPPRDFDLRLKLQGCADDGLCYPPQNWIARVSAPAAQLARAPAATAAEDSGRSGFSLQRLLGGEPRGGDGEFLPVDEAFALSAESTSRDRITVRFVIAEDYYLYRDKLRIDTDAADARLGLPQMPEGRLQHDEYFGDQVVYYDELQFDVPVSADAATTELPISVSFQGCADAGLCYPPTTRQLAVRLAATTSPVEAGTPPRRGTMVSEQDLLAERIRSGNLLAVLAMFFGAGLLLAFTPCVLPMVPILSGIIVGAGRDRPVSRGRAFSLSLAYVLGMAFTYTVAGAAFAAVGQQAQAFFQKPWIIVLFAALFVWLALGMFGVFNLQLPPALQARLNELSSRQKQGSLLGTAIMGALSSLIVTACVAPPLVAALAVIGQSGDVLRGGAALFALSLGMGAPLLLVGASAGRLLPKAGPWMNAVKAAFGVMLLAVAIWML